MRLGRRAFLSTFALIGCARPGRAPGPARRVVSLSPSTTEAIFALGHGARLVGRSRYCDFPPEVKAVRPVGGFVDPSLEAILAVKPDLVIGVQGPGLRDFADRLEARGISTYFPPSQNFAEIGAMLVGLARLLGDEAAGVAARAAIFRERDSVVSALGNRPRPRALLVFGLRPVVVAAPGSFPDEMLTLAGADNVIVGERTRFPTLGIERVLALDPDVVVDSTGGAMREGISITKDLPGWTEVRAVREGHLVVVSDDRVLRPGPRVGQGLAVLARALHPGVVIP
ncbi:MAG: ABC transporter substrate-binding protein [Myxococcales bacterium]|nr:ABC transporter substrate-binding protein [Myxococcales bacterium]